MSTPDPNKITPAQRKWAGKTAVRDRNGDPIALFHAKRVKDEQEWRGLLNEPELQFVTHEQAHDRLGEEPMRLVLLKITDPKRMPDKGQWTYSDINEARAAGYDGIVYLNRHEGILNPAFKEMSEERRAALSDRQFKKAFPEAKDSYIAFDVTQILEVPRSDMIVELSPVQKQMEQVALAAAKEHGVTITEFGNLVLYHGTRTRRAPETGDLWRVGTFFAPHRATAEKFAQQGTGGKPIVMTVEIPPHAVHIGGSESEPYYSLNEAVRVTPFQGELTPPVSLPAPDAFAHAEQLSSRARDHR